MSKKFFVTHSENSSNTLSALLALTDAVLLKDWLDLGDQSRQKAQSLIYDIEDSAYQTMSQALLSMITEKGLMISPLTTLVIIDKVRHAKTKNDLTTTLTNFRLTPANYKLSEVKPFAVNSLDLLLKTRLCLTSEDAYRYLQVARILRTAKKRPDEAMVSTLTIAHANLALILRWARLADFANGNMVPDSRRKEINTIKDKFSGPTDGVVKDAVNITTNIVRAFGVFPQSMIKLLQEQESLAEFFLFVDAIVQVLKEKDLSDEMRLRQRIAYLDLMNHFIALNVNWYLYLKGANELYDLIR